MIKFKVTYLGFLCLGLNNEFFKKDGVMERYNLFSLYDVRKRNFLIDRNYISKFDFDKLKS